MEQGLYRQVADAVASGQPEKARQVVETILDKAQQEGRGSPAVLDALRQRLFATVVDFEGNAKVFATDASKAAYQSFFERIDSDEIADLDVLKAEMRQSYLSPEQQSSLLDYYGQTKGVAVGASSVYFRENQKAITSRIIGSMAELDQGVISTDVTGRQTISSEAQSKASALEAEWREGALAEVGKFLRGDLRDPTSKMTYAELRARSGQQAANSAISGVLDSYYDRRVEEYGKVLRGTKAARDAGADLSTTEGINTFVSERSEPVRTERNALATRIEGGTEDPKLIDKDLQKLAESERMDMVRLAGSLGMDMNSATPNAIADRLGAMFVMTAGGNRVTTREWGLFGGTDVVNTRATVLTSYGDVKRSLRVGLTAREVIHNRTWEGIPVFGVVLPKESREQYAFSVPMFMDEAELRTPDKVNQVMDALGLPDATREAFVRRQATLIRIRNAVRTPYLGSPGEVRWSSKGTN